MQKKKEQEKWTRQLRAQESLLQVASHQEQTGEEKKSGQKSGTAEEKVLLLRVRLIDALWSLTSCDL